MNEQSIDFMYKVFNKCLKQGIFPSAWRKGVITPIPKGGSKNALDPSNYRGITVAVSTYKLFCSILNDRLQAWCNINNILAEEQNGFRSERSCMDHVNALVNMIETRKILKQNTFAAFIDFEKAYDHIDRQLLWKKLENIGLHGNIMCTLRGLYTDVSCCVQVNGSKSNWFDVNTGLKQGCLLSPLLFNLYINDLVDSINSNCKGIPFGDEKVCILLYADDSVLVAQNEAELQCMLNILGNWCKKWKVKVNSGKSEIVHFRRKSVFCTNVKFQVSNLTLKVVNQYKYLGLVLNEFLDFKVTAEIVAKSANRALGLLIAKCKAAGGIPFNCFERLYKSMVLPVIHYGSSIWGHNSYSSIDAVHNRACRFILGVGKYTPTAAILGDSGLTPPVIDQWIEITRSWCRSFYMDSARLNR